MGRGHRGTRDGVDGSLAADPGRLDAETWAEYVNTLAPVGEVGTRIVERRGADRHGLVGGSRRVVAGISIVVTGGNGEVKTSIYGGIDSLVERGGLATTKGHVGSRSLEALALAVLGGLGLSHMLFSSILDALDDVGHGTGAVGAKDLHGVDVCLLGNAVLLATDGTGAVSAVAVAILVSVAVGDGLAPFGTTLEVNMLDVGAGVNDVGINTLTTLGRVQVLVVGAEGKRLAVRDTRKTPGSLVLERGLVVAKSIDDAVLLNVGNLLYE